MPAAVVAYSNHPPGLAHARDTLRKMAQLARDGAHTYEIRRLATRITHGVPSKQPVAELGALYKWVRDNIRYRNDPHGLEWVQAPARTVAERAGDCDDLAVLLGALAQTLGRRIQFETVGNTKQNPGHVYLRAQIPSGEWITLDPVLEPPATSTKPRRDYGTFGARAVGARTAYDASGRELSGAPVYPFDKLELTPGLGATVEGYEVENKTYLLGRGDGGVFVSRATKLPGRPWLRFMRKISAPGHWVTAHKTLKAARGDFSAAGRGELGGGAMTMGGGTDRRDRVLWQTVPYFPQVPPVSGYANPADAGRRPDANTDYRSRVVPGPTITRPTRSGVMGQLPGVPNIPPEYQQVAQQGAALKQAADEGGITADQAIGTGLAILAAVPGGAPFAAAGAAAYAIGKGIASVFGDNPSVKKQLFEKLGRPEKMQPAQLRAAINVAERMAMAIARMNLPAGLGPKMLASTNAAINAYRARLIATAAAGVPAYRGAKFPDGSIADGQGGILKPPGPSRLSRELFGPSTLLPKLPSGITRTRRGPSLVRPSTRTLRLNMPPEIKADPASQMKHAKSKARDVLNPATGNVSKYVPVPSLGQFSPGSLFKAPTGTPSFTSTRSGSPLFRTGLTLAPRGMVAPITKPKAAPVAAPTMIAPGVATGLVMKPLQMVVKPKVTAATLLAQAKAQQVDVIDPLTDTISRWVPMSALSGMGAIRPSLSFSLGEHRHYLDTPRGRVWTSANGLGAIAPQWTMTGHSDPRLVEGARLASMMVGAVNTYAAQYGKAPGRAVPEVQAFQAYDAATFPRAGALKADGLYGPNSKAAGGYYLNNPAMLPAFKPVFASVPVTWLPPVIAAPAPLPLPPTPGPVVLPPTPGPAPLPLPLPSPAPNPVLVLVPEDPTVAAEVVLIATNAAKTVAVPDPGGGLTLHPVAPVIQPAQYQPVPVPPYGTPQPGGQQVPGPLLLPPGGDPMSRQPRYVPPVDYPATEPGGVIMPEAQPSWQTVPGGQLPVPTIPVMPRVSSTAAAAAGLPGPTATAGESSAPLGLPWWVWAIGLAKYTGAI